MAATFNSAINSSNSSNAQSQRTLSHQQLQPHLLISSTASAAAPPAQNPTARENATAEDQVGAQPPSVVARAHRRYLAQHQLDDVFSALLGALLVRQPRRPLHFLHRSLLELREQYAGITPSSIAETRHVHSFDPDKLSAELFVRVRPESVQLLLAGGRHAGIMTKHDSDSAAKAFITNLSK